MEAAARHPEPLVTVGVPTYNRADRLERALRSVLEQTHRRLEVIVSDNASTDATRELCERLAAQDDRLTYTRRPENVGPTANFNGLLAAGAGDLFMFLGDDDWLDPEYVERCARVLAGHPDHALACGAARWYDGDELVDEGVPVTLLHESPARRVRRYLVTVEDNGTFYGLMPRRVAERLPPLTNVPGDDWVFVAAIAALGKVRTLPDVHVNREVGGTGQTFASIASVFGGGGEGAGRGPRFGYLAIGRLVARELARGEGPLAAVGPRPTRLAVAASVQPSLVWRQLRDDLVMPLGRHRATRGLFDALRGLERRRRARHARRVAGQSGD